jgi:hypothetical protein
MLTAAALLDRARRPQPAPSAENWRAIVRQAVKAGWVKPPQKRRLPTPQNRKVPSMPSLKATFAKSPHVNSREGTLWKTRFETRQSRQTCPRKAPQDQPPQDLRTDLRYGGPIRWLRWFLKRARRDCGLVCIDLRVADDGNTSNTPAGDDR